MQYNRRTAGVSGIIIAKYYQITILVCCVESYNNLSKGIQTYRGFSVSDSHGILAYDLDMLVPDMNSDNFNNYYYELNVSDKGRYEGTTTLNSAYIYDYNRSMKVGTFDCTKEALSGNKLSLPMLNLINLLN